MGTAATSRLIWRLLLVLLLVVPGMAQATTASRKVALIIANGAYSHAGALANPPNDGRLIAEAARKAGFDSVTLAPDLTLATFQRALRDFRDKASGAQV